MQDPLAVGGEIKVDIDLSREKAIPDCLPNYAAWERTLEVDRAVREGVRRWAYGVVISHDEVWLHLLAALLSNRDQSRLLSFILQAWREQHQ